MTEDNKNMNFFNRIITSIKDFEKYANENAIDILKIELRKQGLNVK